MRWIALWLLLTFVYVGGWALAQWIAGAGWSLTAETLSHFALVPPAQVAALWVVAAVRRARRDETKGT